MDFLSDGYSPDCYDTAVGTVMKPVFFNELDIKIVTIGHVHASMN